MFPQLREQFLLDPNIHFFNHGSFGATPKPVFEAYQNWQRRLERQPVLFLGREYDEYMNEARAKLAEFIHTKTENVIYVPNATFGMNLVARSLDLQAGDEVLTTNHEYGAVNMTWEFISQKTGAKIVPQAISLPIISAENVIEELWQGVTPQTKVISISHITSPTAIIFPIQEICKRAREAGILTIVDGAHAIGQIPLNMEALGADAYTSNCHKWLCAPKGSAFLYVREDLQEQMDPP